MNNVYIDGLKRVIQTKNTAEVNDTNCMVASGAMVFDDMGRVRQQDHPVQAGIQEAYVQLIPPLKIVP
jgi:hypothetical protein